MKQLLWIIGTLLVCSCFAFAAEDISGKWEGKFVITADGETHDDTACLILKQSGTELTGTGGPNSGEQWPITNGNVEGDKLTFDVQSPGPLIKFSLTVVGGHLKGQAKAEADGHVMTGEMDLQRSK